MTIKENLYVVFQGKRATQDGIERITGWTPLEGIESCLCLKVKSETGRLMLIRLTEDLLSKAEISRDDAFEMAWENVKKEVKIFSYSDHDDLFVITNTDSCWGASSIYDDDKLKEFAERNGVRRLVVFPSSIHEMLLFPLPDSETPDMEMFSDWVREINNSKVCEQDRLADRAYLWDNEKGWVL